MILSKRYYIHAYTPITYILLIIPIKSCVKNHDYTYVGTPVHAFNGTK